MEIIITLDPLVCRLANEREDVPSKVVEAEVEVEAKAAIPRTLRIIIPRIQLHPAAREEDLPERRHWPVEVERGLTPNDIILPSLDIATPWRAARTKMLMIATLIF